MLDQDIIRIAEERIQLELDEQTKSLHQEIGRIKGEMSARGAFRSGATLRLITESCTLTIKNRAQLVWQIFFRFLTTTGISYSETLADELKELIAQHLPKNMFIDIVEHDTKLIGGPSASKLSTQLGMELGSARMAAIKKVGTEIDLFTYYLKRRVEMKEKETTSMIFNIYSPVGAIQTGDSSIANVCQTIDADVREQLNKVLEEIYLKLDQSEIALPYPKKEIIELVQEGQQELKKQTPNITKLRSMLSAVGTAIQTVGSLKPAYETLKQTLTFFGISLP